MVDRGFEPRSDQTKDYKISIYCFSAKHAVLMSKNKDGLARNQNNVSEWLIITPPIRSNFICNISLNLYYIIYSNFIIYFTQTLLKEIIRYMCFLLCFLFSFSLYHLRVIFIIIIHHIFSNQVMFELF
jgi:hypothetical protein